jgi:MFS family permease
MHEHLGAELRTVISVLQTALTPAFLLVAVGSLLNVLTGRLSRIIDRSRYLEDKHPGASGEELVRIVLELRILQKRMSIVGRSILLSVLAAVAVCIMIALLFLMGLTDFTQAWMIVAVFMVALLLLSGALLSFVLEVQTATHAIKVRKEYLALPEE